jgi:DNA-binding NtrC family response regulator
VVEFLAARGWQTHEAADVATAAERFAAASPDVTVVDHQLPDGTALDVLARFRELDPTAPVVVLTGHGSIDLAVRAIQSGADQFLTKPVDLPTLEGMLRRLVDDSRARQRARADKARADRSPLNPFIGRSAAIQELARDAHATLGSNAPVLILGETGAGKGVLAAWIHANGLRQDQAYVDLNCAGLNREFLESELFGHEKGAFTGAVAAKQGLLEIAHRGTVFLDEIGDMDPIVQARLLKVLEEKRFRRLGEVKDRQVDVRLIAATHRDVAAMVRDRTLREDLYYRVNTLPLRVPSLRERREDLPVLARHLLARLRAETGRAAVTLSPAAEAMLLGYHWPGNIRELRNVLERAMLRGGDANEIGPEAIRFDLTLAPPPPAFAVPPPAPVPPASAGPTAVPPAPSRPDGEPAGPPAVPAGGAAPPVLVPEGDGDLTLAELERRHIERTLAEENGHVERTARRLGIPRSTLYERLKRYGISPASR